MEHFISNLPPMDLIRSEKMTLLLLLYAILNVVFCRAAIMEFEINMFEMPIQKKKYMNLWELKYISKYYYYFIERNVLIFSYSCKDYYCAISRSLLDSS